MHNFHHPRAKVDLSIVVRLNRFSCCLRELFKFKFKFNTQQRAESHLQVAKTLLISQREQVFTVNTYNTK